MWQCVPQILKVSWLLVCHRHSIQLLLKQKDFSVGDYFKIKTVQTLFRSLTNRLKKEFIVNFGSVVPGIMPTMITFSLLYCIVSGRLFTVIYTLTEYSKNQ